MIINHLLELWFFISVAALCTGTIAVMFHPRPELGGRIFAAGMYMFVALMSLFCAIGVYTVLTV